MVWRGTCRWEQVARVRPKAAPGLFGKACVSSSRVRAVRLPGLRRGNLTGGRGGCRWEGDGWPAMLGHGQLSSQSGPEWHVRVHDHAARSPLTAAGRSHGRTACRMAPSTTAGASPRRCVRRIARPYSCPGRHEGWQRRLFKTDPGLQERIHSARIHHRLTVAIQILGAYDSRRTRPLQPHRLHPSQPGQAWLVQQVARVSAQRAPGTTRRDPSEESRVRPLALPGLLARVDTPMSP
jgi:hypothetical protein